MRAIITAVLLATLCSGTAHAQDKCGKLELVNQIQLIRNGNLDLVPVTVNGVKRNFLFNTGAIFSAVSPALRLPVDQHSALKVIESNGKIIFQEAKIQDFVAGHMHGSNLTVMVDKYSRFEGHFALDRWQELDLDVDFGTDTLKMFSQDHCPGAVQYWTAPAIAVIPFTMDSNHILVPVTLDGHKVQALINTGESDSTLNQYAEDNLFNLSVGDGDTPEIPGPNPAAPKTYSHVFKSLSLGDVVVNNPKVIIVPVARTTRGLARWDVAIGMDVLRKMHVYFAFKESKMYISLASLSPEVSNPPAPVAAAPQAPQTPAERAAASR